MSIHDKGKTVRNKWRDWHSGACAETLSGRHTYTVRVNASSNSGSYAGVSDRMRYGVGFLPTGVKIGHGQQMLGHAQYSTRSGYCYLGMGKLVHRGVETSATKFAEGTVLSLTIDTLLRTISIVRGGTDMGVVWNNIEPGPYKFAMMCARAGQSITITDRIDGNQTGQGLAFIDPETRTLMFMDGRPRHTLAAGETVGQLKNQHNLAEVFLKGSEERLSSEMAAFSFV
jgi:hypothetical protein